MSNTYRSPPKRITLPREVVARDNIARVAQSRRCYKLQGGITESSRQLRAENDNQLCNSQLRGTGEVFHLLPSVKTPPPRSYRFDDLASQIAEYAMCGEMRYVICNILNHRLICEHILIRNVKFIRVNKK